jgi:HEAT repeat protein
VRDDFTIEVKITVAARVNNRCSNPACRAPTSGPQVDPAKALNVGVAAHITAASPDGPRYNPGLTSDERKHVNNAIWLCQNCGKLIDNDQTRFTTEEIRNWKLSAEAEALERIGKAARPHKDTRDIKGRSLDELLQVYRVRLKNRVNRVYVAGDGKAHELERVFVRPNLMEEHKRPSAKNEFLGLMDAEMRRQRNLFAREYDEEQPDDRETGPDLNSSVNPDDLLRERPHVVIAGAPGCGKTTLLRYLTLKVIGNEGMPIFLELKTLSLEDFNESRCDFEALLFEKAIASILHLQTGERDQLKWYFSNRLRDGQVSIFLDGLDEIRETRFFPSLINAVTEFVNSDYHDNLVVISTRPYALASRFEGLREMEICPLALYQMNAFVNHYYGNDETTRQLLQHLSKNRQLRELCRVPFLLSVVAQLHRSGHEIGNDRLELYRQIVLHLAVKLDSEKSLPLPRFHIYDPEGALKLDFLKHLACDRLLLGYVNEDETDRESARLVFTGELLLEQAKYFLKGESHLDVNPRWLAADVKATPLLRAVGTDIYAFAHLTIQEYFAAVALSRRNDCAAILCRSYFNPTIAEMEVLPMVLGLVQRESMYGALQDLPESLILTNLRVRTRSVSYTSQIVRPSLQTLIKRLLEIVVEENLDETPYQEKILRDFSAANSVALELAINSIGDLLRCDEYSVRIKAVKALGTLGSERAIGILSDALKDDNCDVRVSAAEALGRLSGDRVRDALLKGLKDEAVLVRLGAIESLGKLRSELAAKPLIEALSDPDLSVQYSAAAQLGQLRGEVVVNSLLGALRDEHENVRRHAAVALGHIGELRATEALIAALKDSDAGVRGNAASSLGWLGERRSVDALIEALKDEDVQVRSNVADALTRFGEERAFQALIEAFEEEEKAANSFGASVERPIKALMDVLMEAGRDSESRGEAELTAIVEGSKRVNRRVRFFKGWNNLETLTEALKNEDSNVRQSATEFLGQLGGEGSVEALLVALNDPDRNVRHSATYALGRIGSKRAIDALIVALRDKTNPVRWYAALVLGNIGGERSLSALIPALNDGDRHVRKRAAEALGRIGGDKAVRALIEAFKDKSNSERWQAAEALGRIGGEKAVEALIEVWKDRESPERWRSVDALGRAGGEKATDVLIEAVRDKNNPERWRAIDALEKVGGLKALKALIAVMRDKHNSDRGRALAAIVEIGGLEAVDILVEALNDEESPVRRSAAYKLAEFDNAVLTVGLIRALREGKELVRRKAAEVVGYYSEDPDVLDELISVAAKDSSDDVRNAASKARVKYEHKLHLFGIKS